MTVVGWTVGIGTIHHRKRGLRTKGTTGRSAGMTVMITITLRTRQRGILGPDFPVTIRAQRGLAAGHLVEGLEIQETDRTLWIFLIARRSLRSQLLLKGECSKYFTAHKKMQIYQLKTPNTVTTSSSENHSLES
jgi:hypothetical protein